MSSFLSNSASVAPHRRRLASQPQLFPVGPQPSEPNMHGPKQVADCGPAPIAVGPGESASQRYAHAGATGCPPPCSGAAPAEPAAVACCGEGNNARHHGVQVRDVEAPLVGIARLAASSPSAESVRKSEQRPEYFFLPVRSILNKCDSNRVPFEWTINPYRGCEFACKYCYARYTHEYMDLDGGEFERRCSLVVSSENIRTSAREPTMVARSTLRSAPRPIPISRPNGNIRSRAHVWKNWPSAKV